MTDSNDTLIQLELPLENTERWKDIPGYEGFYQVSDTGRVRRVIAYKQHPAYGLLRLCYDESGYQQLHLYFTGKRRRMSVHCLVMRAFVGEQGKQDINHINGIKDDNRLENLEYCTHSENIRHAYRVLGGKIHRGEEHAASRLKEHEVREIRKLLADGAAQADLARRFNVDKNTIYAIAHRITWKHVKD